MSIGDRMKAQRKSLKMSADELAARLGKDRSTIYRYEKGEIENVPLELLEPIAEALETTPQYLLGWEMTEEKEKDNDTLASIIVRLRMDEDFRSVVESLYDLDSAKIKGVQKMLQAFSE